jgi:hypothetical protein
MALSINPVMDSNGDGIADAVEVKGLPTDKKKRASEIANLRLNRKRNGQKVVTRKGRVFVAKTDAAADAIGEAFPVEGRGRKAGTSKYDALFSD